MVAYRQWKGIFIPHTGGGSGSSFVGAGDIVSGASFFVSIARAYSAAFAATAGPIGDFTDTATGTDNFTMNILTTGFADVASLSAHYGATPISCKKAYDQTGNGLHFSQATLTAMPTVTLSALNSLPGFTFVAALAQMLITATAPNIAQPRSHSHVEKRTGVTNAKRSIFGDTGGKMQHAHTNSANGGVMFLGTANQNWAGGGQLTENTFHAVQLLADGGTQTKSKIDSNAVENVGNPGTSATSGTLRLGGDAFGAPMEGIIMESMAWPSDITANWVNLNSNQHDSSTGYNF